MKVFNAADARFALRRPPSNQYAEYTRMTSAGSATKYYTGVVGNALISDMSESILTVSNKTQFAYANAYDADDDGVLVVQVAGLEKGSGLLRLCVDSDFSCEASSQK